MIDPSIVRRLAKIDIFTYFKTGAMPSFVEPAIITLIAQFQSAQEVERRNILTRWPPGASPPLGWFARKMAGQAVRMQSEEDVYRGMVALALSSQSSDWRNDLSPMSLLFDADAIPAHPEIACP